MVSSQLLSRVFATVLASRLRNLCVRNLLACTDPVLAGYQAGAKIAEADLILVLDSSVPWIELNQAPPEKARIIHLGPDPHFARMPVRSHRSDLNIGAEFRWPLLRGWKRFWGLAMLACRARLEKLSQQSEQRRPGQTAGQTGRGQADEC